jgi:hypothetical protein
MQQLAEEWKELSVHKYLIQIIDTCGDRIDKFNSRFSKPDHATIKSLFEKVMKELYVPEQLRFLKAIGSTCLEVSVIFE